MDVRSALLLVIADNDQDRAAAKEFFRTASNDELKAVWTRIQDMPDDGVDGIVARLAQLAFGEMVVETKGASNA